MPSCFARNRNSSCKHAFCTAERIMFSACLSFLLNRIFRKRSNTLRRSPTTLTNLEYLLYRLQSTTLSNLTSGEHSTTTTVVQTSSFPTSFDNHFPSSCFKKSGPCHQSRHSPRSLTLKPLDGMSAGFYSEGT